jgi:hypothetical protein
MRSENSGNGIDLSTHWHVEALRRAGFREAGVVRQSGDDHVVIAVR